MPENANRAHLIGFPAHRSPEHPHYIQGFLYTCEAEGKTPATVESYRENLARFIRAVQELELPRQPALIRRDHVRRYLAHLRKLGSSISTVNDRLTALRLWFKWLSAEGLIDDNPTDGVAKARGDRNGHSVVTPDQVQELLQVCQRQGRNGPQFRRKAERDRAIILLLYNTGLRASEMVSLDLADVDLDRLLFHVRHGKGRKQRVVSLGKVPRQALWRYIAHIRGREAGPLFRSEAGGRLLRTSLTQLMTKLAQKTNWTDKRCHPHMFRRAFAVGFLRNGGDPFRLQILLGHEKLEMTRLYSQALLMDDAIEAHAQFGPADRLTL